MIKEVTEKELEILAELMRKLWPNHSKEQLTKELIKTNKFLLSFKENQYVGFAQCSIRRDYVEGCETSPIGYLEGIYIEKEYRNKGYARELVEAAEAWSKEQGCIEFASDCEVDNIDSLAFHQAIGFNIANTIICFTKKI